MIEPAIAPWLAALARWSGQVLALKLGAISSCVCPPCPAHSFSCQCHGDSAAGQPAVNLAVVFSLLLLLGLVVGFVLGGLFVWIIIVPRFRENTAEASERELVQLELRRLRKGQ